MFNYIRYLKTPDTDYKESIKSDDDKDHNKWTSYDEKRKSSAAIYRVGYTEDNRIILSFGDNPTISSVIMTEVGVRQLIRMLESTLTTETSTNDDEC